VAGSLDLLFDRRQEELGVRPIETGRAEMSALAWVEVVDRFAVEQHPSPDLGRSQPR